MSVGLPMMVTIAESKQVKLGQKAKEQLNHISTSLFTRHTGSDKILFQTIRFYKWEMSGNINYPKCNIFYHNFYQIHSD